MSRRHLAWALFVIIWTGSLLTPIEPKSEVDPLKLYKAIASKGLHVVAYAALAVFTGWLRATPPRRLLLLFFVLAHAGITEFAQTFIEGRTGLASDVCLDHLGVLIGLGLSWKWWTSPEPA